MKKLTKNMRHNKIKTWEEESGLLDFLASAGAGAKKFSEDFGFGIEPLISHPSDIDGDTSAPLKAGFVLVRNNEIMPELQYCLYSLLKGRKLHGYIGLYKEGHISTLKELEPIVDFKKAHEALFAWLKQLVRASCEKITL